MIPAFIEPLPEALLPLQQRAKQRWLNALAEHQLPAVPWSDERQALFLHLATLSDFILEYAVRCPNKTIALTASGEIGRASCRERV